MNSTCGGLNPYKDCKAKEVANRMYTEFRRRRTDIENIAKHTDFSIEQVTLIKNYIFNDSHVLTSGYSRFAPSYEMAESWRRLSERQGKNIQPHDILLLYHELYEIELLIAHNKYSQSRAYFLAEQKYNYSKACMKYYMH